MLIPRSGKPLTFFATAPADTGAYASEALAIVAKFLDNRPTTWLRIDNFAGGPIKVFFDVPPVAPHYAHEAWVIADGAVFEAPIEVTNLWILGGLFQLAAGIRIP